MEKLEKVYLLRSYSGIEPKSRIFVCGLQLQEELEKITGNKLQREYFDTSRLIVRISRILPDGKEKTIGYYELKPAYLPVAKLYLSVSRLMERLKRRLRLKIDDYRYAISHFFYRLKNIRLRSKHEEDDIPF